MKTSQSRWETGEFEAVYQDNVVRIVCTDNLASINYRVIAIHPKGNIITCNKVGISYALNRDYDIYLRKKSSEELPEDRWANVYSCNKYASLYPTKEEADNSAINSQRIALLHIVHEWED